MPETVIDFIYGIHEVLLPEGYVWVVGRSPKGEVFSRIKVRREDAKQVRADHQGYSYGQRNGNIWSIEDN